MGIMLKHSGLESFKQKKKKASLFKKQLKQKLFKISYSISQTLLWSSCFQFII